MIPVAASAVTIIGLTPGFGAAVAQNAFSLYLLSLAASAAFRRSVYFRAAPMTPTLTLPSAVKNIPFSRFMNTFAHIDLPI